MGVIHLPFTTYLFLHRYMTPTTCYIPWGHKVKDTTEATSSTERQYMLTKHLSVLKDTVANTKKSLNM